MSEFIDKIGVEFEGGWAGDPGIAPLDMDIVVDRSIDGTMASIDKRLNSPHVGEIISEPMERSKLAPFIDKYWPTETNSTCGYHIHLSFKKPLYYSLCTRKTFFFDLLDSIQAKCDELELPDKHYLRTRMRGGNPFVNFDFDPQGQIELQRKNGINRVRYGALNFCAKVHGTMEFRLYPTFRKKPEAHTFTDLYLDFVENYLRGFEGRSFRRAVILKEHHGRNVVDHVKGV